MVGVRVKKHYKNPNKFFEYCLSGLAKVARTKSWKSSNVYTKALNSLKKYPLKLSSGKECQILSGFGPSVCNILDAKLLELSQKKGLSLEDALACGNALKVEELQKICSPFDEILENTQKLLTSAPIVMPTPLPLYPQATIKVPSPSGDVVNACGIADLLSDCGAPSSSLAGGSYTVILIVDVRETFGESLRIHSVAWESRGLPVGDFVWVARRLAGDVNTDEEIVLGVVVERKRADDLGSSIVDGRFMEQKGRMTKLGFRKVYLFEECGSMHNLRISYETLLQSMVNAQIIDGCDFVNCRNGEHSVAYLASLTKMFQSKSRVDLDIYSDGGRPPNCRALNPLWGIPWTEFVTRGKKSPVLPLREEFGRHLLQVHSITGPKASDIVAAFPTPHSLMAAYDSLSTVDEKKGLLQAHKKTAVIRKMTQKISEMIFYMYNMK